MSAPRKPRLRYPLRVFLDVSTAHLTAATRDHLDKASTIEAQAAKIAADLDGAETRPGPSWCARGPTGWFVWCPEEEPDSGLPDDLRAIMIEARKRGAEYVLIDADGADIDGLATYEWE